MEEIAAPNIMDSIWEIAGALIVIAVVVVRFTKTDKDDKIVDRVKGIFMRLKK